MARIEDNISQRAWAWRGRGWDASLHWIAERECSRRLSCQLRKFSKTGALYLFGAGMLGN
jgi:hypothetical protein